MNELTPILYRFRGGQKSPRSQWPLAYLSGENWAGVNVLDEGEVKASCTNLCHLFVFMDFRDDGKWGKPQEWYSNKAVMNRLNPRLHSDIFRWKLLFPNCVSVYTTVLLTFNENETFCFVNSQGGTWRNSLYKQESGMEKHFITISCTH